MRAKMRVSEVKKYEYDGKTSSVSLRLNAVCKNTAYPEDGSDEDNTFARWTPNADLSMMITNPNLFDTFEVGQKFYVDFTPAE